MRRALCLLALALSEAAWGAPRHARAAAGARGEMDAIFNLELLIPLLIEDALAEDLLAEGALAEGALAEGALAEGALAEEALAEGALAERAAAAGGGGGGYSDIPADAFLLDPAPAPAPASVKKDLGQFRAADPPPPSAPPAAAVEACARYFQGRAAPPAPSAEALLQLCTELLDDAGVDRVPRPEHCPPPSPVPAAPAPPAAPAAPGPLGPLLRRLALALRPPGPAAGARRRWIIMNSNSPDPTMRQYVDVEK